MFTIKIYDRYREGFWQAGWPAFIPTPKVVKMAASAGREIRHYCLVIHISSSLFSPENCARAIISV